MLGDDVMLTIFPHDNPTPSDRMWRRSFLQVGTCLLGGLSLSDLLQLQAAPAVETPFVKDISVVLLYFSGGASHIETFDPMMDARTETRSQTGEVATTMPGVTFGGTFPQLARHAHQMAIVRSFHHRNTDHAKAHVHVLTGGTDPTGEQRAGFSMGSLYARLAGTNSPRTGMPIYSLLTTPEVDPQYRSELTRVRRGSWPGALGPRYAPFEPGAAGGIVDSMSLNIPQDRFTDRRRLLDSLDEWKRRYDKIASNGGTSKFDDQAVDLLLGSASDAVDLSREDPALLERYDTSHIPVGFRKFKPSPLGKQMLMARRLCEAGCRFVTVHSPGWDMHADANNPGMTQGMEMLGRTADQAIATFLEDIEQRGLTKKVMLVLSGDFGRTPKVNKKGGRDHWSRLSTLAFAGGDLNMGQVIGQSARDGGEPLADPVSLSQFHATVMHSLIDVGQFRLNTRFPRELADLVENGTPISPLMP